MPPQKWTTASSRPIYENKWLKLREDIAAMPDGRTTIYTVVTFAGAAGVLPFVDEDHVILLRQYRYVFGENHRWEMPTGGIVAGETPEAAAQRELQEEIGYRAGRLEWVSTYYTSKCSCDETAHIFLGFDLEPSMQAPDETEFLEVATLPFREVLEMVKRSEIRDGMTITAVLHAARLRGWQ